MTTNGSTPPIDAWQVASMRFTAFSSEVVPLERLPWWDDVVGVPPEAVVSRPKTGQSQAQGEFEGRRLTLQIQPGRVEWSLNPPAKAAEDPGLPLLGPFPEVLASLSKVVTAWLPQAPAVTRVAFGAARMQQVETVRSGYVLVTKYLRSVAIDPDGSSDLLYQINRPRPSVTGIEGLRMNRLTKWSVQVGQLVIMTLGTEGIATRITSEDVVCRLDLDINTAPDFVGTLPAERLGDLFQEMTDLGREIAQRGDVS